MTIAFDAFTATTFTVDPSTTHTPVGTPAGAIAFVLWVSGDGEPTVSYGSSDMGSPVYTRVQSAGGELAGTSLGIWLLGSSVPTGAQTFAVNGGATGQLGYIYTVTAADDIEFVASQFIEAVNSGTNPSATLSLGGVESFVAEAFTSGQNTPTQIAPRTGWTERNEQDLGATTVGSYSYDTIGTSDVTIGVDQGDDDIFCVAAAFRESAGGGPTLQSVSGGVSPSGALTKQLSRSIAGALSPAGAQNRSTADTVAGSVTPSGGLTKQVGREISGALSPAGGQNRSISDSVSGSVTPTGDISASLVTATAVSGSMVPSGALTRQVSRSIAGSLAPASNENRSIAKGISGALSSIVGALTASLTELQSASGVLAPVGAVARLIAKVLPEDLGQGADAEVEPTGALTRSTTRSTGGAVAPSGVLQRLVQKAISGSLAPSGTSDAQTVVSALLTGAVGMAGSLTRRTLSAVSGAVGPSGSISRHTSTTAAGEVTPVGSSSAQSGLSAVLAGSVAFAGALTRLVARGVAGALSPIGTVAKRVSTSLAGGFIPVGSLSAGELTVLAQGSVAISGSLSVSHIPLRPTDSRLARARYRRRVARATYTNRVTKT